MDIEKAIEILKAHEKNEFTGADAFVEAYDIAIQALEKQVGKKPDTETIDHFQCPDCGNITIPPCEGNVGLKYCGYCGQKISWYWGDEQ